MAKNTSVSSVVAAPQPDVDDLRIRRIGYLILFVTFGLFGGWALFAPLESAALGPGVVTVKNYRKTVQHLEGGIVKALHVRDGDVVEEGDVLIELDGTQTLAETEMLRSQLIAARSMENRLIAERDGKDKVDFLNASLIGIADLTDPRVTEARDNERLAFTARRNAHLGEMDVLKKRKVQLEEQIRGFQQVISTKQDLVNSYQKEIVDLNALLKDGFIDKQRLLEQERNVTRLRSEIADLYSSSARARLQVGETELQIAQLQKTFIADVIKQLTEVQTQAFDLAERFHSSQEKSQRLQVRAPEDGMVLGMKLHTVGGVISPGTPLLDIVPSNEELVVEAQLSPADIDRIVVGAMAKVRFTAFNSHTTPVIEGVLKSVSGDRLVDEKTGAAYYLGRIELTEQGRKELASLKLVPGMPAEVLVNSGERTFFSYLTKPVHDAFSRSLIED